MQEPNNEGESQDGVMYVRCNSLEAAYVIALDANEVLKTYDGGMREAGRG